MIDPLDAWAASIDRCVEAGLAYLDAERRLSMWQETARIYALPTGHGEMRVRQAEDALARRGLEVVMTSALEAGHADRF